MVSIFKLSTYPFFYINDLLSINLTLCFSDLYHILLILSLSIKWRYKMYYLDLHTILLETVELYVKIKYHYNLSTLKKLVKMLSRILYDSFKSKTILTQTKFCVLINI